MDVMCDEERRSGRGCAIRYYNIMGRTPRIPPNSPMALSPIHQFGCSFSGRGNLASGSAAVDPLFPAERKPILFGQAHFEELHPQAALADAKELAHVGVAWVIEGAIVEIQARIAPVVADSVEAE